MTRHEPIQARGKLRLKKMTDTARELVLEHGREYVTTAMIAESCGASIGTVYRYFDDMHDVLAVVQPIHRHGVTAVLDLHCPGEIKTTVGQTVMHETVCDYDKEPWPCVTFDVLTGGPLGS